MTRLDTALRIGSLGASLIDVRDMVKAFVLTPPSSGLEISLRGTVHKFNVPHHLSEEVLAVVGKLLSDHLDAELADAFHPTEEELDRTQ